MEGRDKQISQPYIMGQGPGRSLLTSERHSYSSMDGPEEIGKVAKMRVACPSERSKQGQECTKWRGGEGTMRFLE